MDKKIEGNKDWIAREEGRFPSKGAKAAERASAGLGATDHDAELLADLLPTGPRRPKPLSKMTERDSR